MNHYFIENRALASNRQTILHEFGGHRFVFTTDTGIFSKGHIDPASEILVNNVPPLSGSLLDMGCGYGAMGVMLAKAYSLQLTLADINGRALELAALNAAQNGVSAEIIKSDCFDSILAKFDTIVLNPPIHAGKAVTYKMYEQAAGRLNPGGALYVVTLKKHGAESTLNKLRGTFGNCEVVYKRKGYFIFLSQYSERRAIAPAQPQAR